MKLFNTELLKDKNFEEGKALLEEAGYTEGSTACDTDVPGYVFYDYYYYLSDEDGDIIDTITYEVTCDADEFINDDDDDQGTFDEEYAKLLNMSGKYNITTNKGDIAMKTICSNYIQFANLNSGDKITLKQFHNIFNGGSSITIKDNSIRGAKTVSYWDVKVGDRVNNGTRFIEIIANTVINRNGYELDFDAVVILMDDEIREGLHSKLTLCREQEFFTAYEKAHEEVYNEEWELSKANPTW